MEQRLADGDSASRDGDSEVDDSEARAHAALWKSVEDPEFEDDFELSHGTEDRDPHPEPTEPHRAPTRTTPRSPEETDAINAKVDGLTRDVGEIKSAIREMNSTLQALLAAKAPTETPTEWQHGRAGALALAHRLRRQCITLLLCARHCDARDNVRERPQASD